MLSLWIDSEGKKRADNALRMRVYTSRLLGADPNLVLHGGGNTSVKVSERNIFGEEEKIIYIKGSGWDLGTIEAAGFAPVKLEQLIKMASLDSLGDSDMVKLQRAAMTEPGAPTPSVEAVLHALIPFKFVDHTHADAVVTISNTPNGEDKIKEIYGERVLIVPYVMPGFILAQKIYDMTKDVKWEDLQGIILMNHGVFTFDDDAKSSYLKMIDIVTEAEEYLKQSGKELTGASIKSKDDPLALSSIRKKVMKIFGAPILALFDNGADSVAYSNLSNLNDISSRGPLTPDHIIRTKQMPVILGNEPIKDIDEFSESYKKYFDRNTDGKLTSLDSAPRWAVWKEHGIISFGTSLKAAGIVSDIKDHTINAIQQAENLGGWTVLPEKDLFAIEYWELEQAKLKKTGSSLEFQGKIALVTGAASGIGKSVANLLLARGAAVAALDINPAVVDFNKEAGIFGIECDLTSESSVKDSVDAVIRKFGGLDIVVSNAGIFPSSSNISDMEAADWDESLAVNLTSHQLLLKTCIPFLRNGIEPAVVMVASKNVPAPGPGAAAYSVAKAGLTQLARVAALELGGDAIRVNVVHPNAVYDTKIWTPELLRERADNYGISVEEYKTNNVLKTEITSRDVAELICTIAGTSFSKTTGAQIPIDGGNERVI